jgi:hypothetical protein
LTIAEEQQQPGRHNKGRPVCIAVNQPEDQEKQTGGQAGKQ